MKILKTLTISIGLILGLIGTSRAVSANSYISITSGPTFSPSLDNNTITASELNGNTLVKLFGQADFTQADSNALVTISIGGDFSLRAGDPFALNYQFSSTLTGTSSVPYTISGTIDYSIFGFQLESTVTSSGLLMAGSTNVSDSKSVTNPSGQYISGSYTATVSFDTSAMQSGDKLSLDIPSNSIDLSVVPEPSTFALAGLGAVAIAGLRRKFPRGR